MNNDQRTYFDVVDALPRLLQVYQDAGCNMDDVKSFVLGTPVIPWSELQLKEDVLTLWQRVLSVTRIK